MRFVDRSSNRVVWESHAQETAYADMDTDKEIRKALAKMLEGFPPSAG